MEDVDWEPVRLNVGDPLEVSDPDALLLWELHAVPEELALPHADAEGLSEGEVAGEPDWDAEVEPEEEWLSLGLRLGLEEGDCDRVPLGEVLDDMDAEGERLIMGVPELVMDRLPDADEEAQEEADRDTVEHALSLALAVGHTLALGLLLGEALAVSDVDAVETLENEGEPEGEVLPEGLKDAEEQPDSDAEPLLEGLNEEENDPDAEGVALMENVGLPDKETVSDAHAVTLAVAQPDTECDTVTQPLCEGDSDTLGHPE